MKISHPEWRADQKSGNYPFADGCSLLSDTGVKLAAGLFDDAHLYPLGANGSVSLGSIEVDSLFAKLSIVDQSSNEVAYGHVVDDEVDNVRLFDKYGRDAGVLVSSGDRLASLLSWTIGLHAFQAGAAEFAVTCQLPMPQPGVRGILLDDGTLVAGQVWLVGSDGVVLSTAVGQTLPFCEQLTDVKIVRVDVVGDPLYRRRLCEGLEFTAPRPIRKLRITNNGQTYELLPTGRGNVFFQVGDETQSRPAIRIRQLDDGLVLEMLGAAIADG